MPEGGELIAVINDGIQVHRERRAIRPMGKDELKVSICHGRDDHHLIISIAVVKHCYVHIADNEIYYMTGRKCLPNGNIGGQQNVPISYIETHGRVYHLGTKSPSISLRFSQRFLRSCPPSQLCLFTMMWIIQQWIMGRVRYHGYKVPRTRNEHQREKRLGSKATFSGMHSSTPATV